MYAKFSLKQKSLFNKKFFSTQNYDLAIIGGGPGGNLKIFYNYFITTKHSLFKYKNFINTNKNRIYSSNKSRTKKPKNCMYRKKRNSWRNMLKCRMYPFKITIKHLTKIL